MDFEKIKLYIELAGTIIFAIAMLIILIKITIKKRDKNNDGKLQLEELTDADTQFIKEMLNESIKTIATGMLQLNGLKGQKAYELMLNEVKKSKNIFKEIEKGELKNEKNS